MNKAAKVLLSAGALLVMSGGLLALSGWAMGADTRLSTVWSGRAAQSGWESAPGSVDESSFQDGALTDLHLAAFDALDIDLDLGNVIVKTGEDYGISLQWPGAWYTLDYGLREDGTLWITGYRDSEAFWPNAAVVLEVYVPEGVRLEEVDVYCDMGDVELYDITVGELTVDSSLGRIAIANIQAETVDLWADLGDVEGSSLTVTHSLTAECSMGNLTLQGDLQGEVDLDCDMGNIEVTLTQEESRL